MQGVLRLSSKTPSNWLTAVNSFCIHGWKSINARLSYGKYFNKIRSRVYASCFMSLAGIFQDEVRVDCFYVTKSCKRGCVDNHFQKHQGSHYVCKQSSVPRWKMSHPGGHCGNSLHFTYTNNHRFITKPVYGLNECRWKDKH